MPALPRAIFFDLDATLLDDGQVTLAVEQTCTEIAAACPDLDREVFSRANAAAFNIYWSEAQADWTLGSVDSETVSREVWRRALLACGIEDDHMARLAHQTFSSHVEKGHRLYEDAIEILHTVRGRFLLGVVTNGPSGIQREKLRSTGIEDVFEVVLVSGEQGVAKPDPRIFQQGLDDLAVEATQAWHIGDVLAVDVAGAHAAGMTAVWLNRRRAERKQTDPVPDIEIASLAELAGLLSMT